MIFCFFDIKNAFFSKVKNPKNVLRPNSVSPTSRGGIFYCVGPCFLLQKTRQKAVEKKVKKKSRPKKKLGQKLQKIPLKNQFKIHNINPKNGVALKAPRCCFEFCIGFL